MKLGDYLDRELVIADLESSNKREALREMLKCVGARHTFLDLERAERVLLERESLGSTGIGEGVAIPHGKMNDLDQIILAVARSRDGVQFDALDLKPCHIFFLVLAPEQTAGMHLRILAHISRLLKDQSFKDSFMSLPDKDILWDLLKDA